LEMIPFAEIDSLGGRAMADRQLSLAEALMDPRLGVNARLEAISAVIDWAPLERLAGAVHASAIGRRPYRAGAMIKALYLQMLYGLSDPQLEEALNDRLSFRRFCGFGPDETMPDETTIWRFKAAAAAKGVMQACFAEVNRQLDGKGLIVRKGTLMDATIVAAASRKPDLKQGKGARLAREPGASWTRKNNRSYFGYRLHVATDQDYNIIRRLALTPAHVAESLVAEALLCGDEKAVYADKGYESKKRRAALAGARRQGSHLSPLAQEPESAAALAGPAQPTDRQTPRRHRAGVRDHPPGVRLRARPRREVRHQPGRHVPLGHGVQLAPRRRPAGRGLTGGLCPQTPQTPQTKRPHSQPPAKHALHSCRRHRPVAENPLSQRSPLGEGTAP
jgi:transposase, IS5 family